VLHAVTHAILREIGVEEFKARFPETCREVYGPDNPFFTTLFFDGFKNCIEILENVSVNGKEKALQFLREFSEGILHRVRSFFTQPPPNGFLNLCHGDCWNNNMLFKVDPENHKILHHMLVDWQATRLASHNLDLTNFFFTSVQPSVRRENMMEMLEHYYAQLKKTLSSFGIQCPITFEEHVAEYKRVSGEGLSMGLFTVAFVELCKFSEETSREDEAGDPDILSIQSTIKKWIAKHPQRAKEVAKDITAIVQEFQNFQ